MKKVTIISLGWLGLALYHKLTEYKIEVSGSYFNSPKNLSNEYQFDINSTEPNQYIDESDIVLIAIPPSKIIDEDRFNNFIISLSQKHIIFISSTSVYGAQGNVNELTQPIPETLNGKRLLGWEKNIQAKVKRYQIIRSAGQYGQHRHPGNFLSGREGISGGDDRINLISQADLVSIIISTIHCSKSQTINAVNSNHPKKRDFYTSYCKKNNIPLPLFSDEKTINSKIVSTIYDQYLVKSALDIY